MVNSFVSEDKNLQESGSNQGLLMEIRDDGVIAGRAANGVELNNYLAEGCSF
ncbi:MAG: hypothetical protein ACD_24C00444G0001 [uncultured bacterium]|nr:MAG: hypothetical protein ACD_24C00444G0001 [uncultured bacterium]